MMSFLTSIWAWITWAVSALMPFKRGVTLSPIVRWIIWILLDLTFLGVLLLINSYAAFAQSVGIPPVLDRLGISHLLRQIWLPILGQLFVFLCIALYWFYLVWFSELDDSPFPDIDDAWQEAMATLAQAGIHLPKLPLFLVLGRPESPEAYLFEASGMKLAVAQTPGNANAPLHVFADRNAVYVTCRDASVLGKLAEVLSLENLPEGASAVDQDAGEEFDKTMRPGSKEQVVIEMLRAPTGQAASPIRRRALRRAFLGKPLGSDFLSDPKELGRYKARLAHLCHLIARDRQPHCPINGILLLVPLAGTDTTGEAQFTAQAVQEDLNVARAELKLDCPLVSLVVDLEQMPGFPDFLQRQPPKELGNRHGNGFPMATRLSRDEVVEQVRLSLAWVCTTYLQDSVYRLFQGETPANTDPSPLFPGNARMVLLLDEMNERAEALSWIISRAIAPESDSLFRYAGCYLAATGPKGSQGFVAGVFQKLVKEQSCVGWTEAAIVEDTDFHTWAKYYFALAVLLALSWCALLIWIVMTVWR